MTILENVYSDKNEIREPKKITVMAKHCFRPTSYGRELIKSHVKTIAANFDYNKLGEIILYENSLKDDYWYRYEVIDGNHRLEAMKIRFGDDVHFKASLLPPPLTEEQRATEYKNRNKERKPLTPIDIFRAEVVMEIPEALEIKKISEDTESGIIGYNTTTGGYPNIASVRDLRTLHKAGNLEKVITILRSAYDGTPKSYTKKATGASILRAVNKFLSFFEDHANFSKSRLINILQNYPAQVWCSMIDKEAHVSSEGITALINEYNKRLSKKNRLSDERVFTAHPDHDTAMREIRLKKER